MHTPVLKQGAAFKLLALDLDGTLLDADKRVSPRVAEAVARIRQNGVAVVLATGRGPRTAVPYHAELGLCDPMVVHNGALVYHPVSGAALLHQPVPARAARGVAAIALETGMDNLWVGTGDRVYCHKDDQVSRFFLEGAEPNGVGRVQRVLENEPATKLLTWGRPERAEQFLHTVRDSLGAAVSFVTYQAAEHNLMFVEVMRAGVSKRSAIEVVARRFGLAMSQVAAAGDEVNDLELVSAAGCGIVMGTAPQQVRDQADLIVPAGSADGLADALEQVFLPGMR